MYFERQHRAFDPWLAVVLPPDLRPQPPLLLGRSSSAQETYGHHLPVDLTIEARAFFGNRAGSRTYSQAWTILEQR